MVYVKIYETEINGKNAPFHSLCFIEKHFAFIRRLFSPICNNGAMIKETLTQLHILYVKGWKGSKSDLDYNFESLLLSKP